MKLRYPWLAPLLALSLTLSPAPARAQGPSIDPTFVPGQVYAPGEVRDAFVQADGKLVLAGTFTQAGGMPATSLARLLPGSNQADAIFQANVAGLQGRLERIFSLPANTTLLQGQNLRLGATGPVRQVLRLNADGTLDTGFSLVLGRSLVGFISSLAAVVAQPDGKLLIAGNFGQVNGQPAAHLARLNPDGTLDASFQAGTVLNGPGLALALLPNGNILVAGDFTAVQGQARPGVARLLPTGVVDAAFVPATPPGYTARGLAAQPDGKVLVLARARPAGSTFPILSRLLPTGALDASFQPGAGFNRLPSLFAALASPLVQPDGNILVPTATGTYDGTAVGGLVRLLPGGALDPAFDNAGALRQRSRNELVSALALLPTGQVLVAGVRLRAGTPGTPPQPLLRLSAAGIPDAAFAPRVLLPGVVRDVARQPDGKLVIGGEFTELNGQPAANLARLTTTGTRDASFGVGTDGLVRSVAVQPDGKVLVAGDFDYLAGSPRISLGRVLPTGAIDVAFVPATNPFASATAESSAQAWLQPDGNVLLGGFFNLRAPTGRQLLFARVLGSTGARDFSFVPADSSYAPNEVLVQASGRIVVAGLATFGGQRVAAWGLRPNGTLDPTFMLQTPRPVADQPYGRALAQAPSGQLYIAQELFSSQNDTVAIVRTDPNGVADPSFQTAINYDDYLVFNSLAVQPNGRLLVGGLFSAGPQGTALNGSLRLLPSGAADPSYDPTRGPGSPDFGPRLLSSTGAVNRFLIQPDGAIVAAGSFTTVDGLPVSGIVRLLDPHVLATPATAALPGLAAWPNPAHGTATVALPPALGAGAMLRLHDALGRELRRQALATGAGRATVALAGLPPGLYLVEVRGPAGRASCRLVVE